MTDSLKGFFTRLWSPAASGAEQQGTAYLYDEEGNLISETGTGGANSTGSTQYIYLPTANGPMPIAAVINGEIYAVHSDHLNTPRRLTNSQGQAVWQWPYSAFGDDKPTIAKNRFANLEVNPNPGTTSSPDITYNVRYPNHYADEESGLFENRDRFYSPSLARYTQGDAFGLSAGTNRFVYALDDPLSVFDDDGLAPKKPNGAAPAPYSPLTGGTIKPSPIPGWQPLQLGVPGRARIDGEGSAGAGRGVVGPLCSSTGVDGSKGLARYDGPKPQHHVNPAHDPRSARYNPQKTPQPPDAESVYGNAVPDDPINPRNWYGLNSAGKIYRFSSANDGTAHFSGMEGAGDGIRNMTDYALQRIGRR
ncbi:hypothetical protein GCM10023165_36420 [Variovorax defluvii]|uniref:RHS repeat-associated protein n=1 Tax=Variovorax defluvii TaxID=913761 RepID=A0ABP8I1N4_9BURK